MSLNLISYLGFHFFIVLFRVSFLWDDRFNDFVLLIDLDYILIYPYWFVYRSLMVMYINEAAAYC